jgi:hypothetical protein
MEGALKAAIYSTGHKFIAFAARFTAAPLAPCR